MNLPEHHESPVVFVYLKGSVEMFFSLSGKRDLPWRNEMSSRVHGGKAENTHAFQVFDEEIAQPQIMANFLEWRKDRF